MGVKGVETLQAKLNKITDSAAFPEQIRNVAAYTKRALHNAPNHRPPTKKKKIDYENRVYFPDPKGGMKDSGMTVKQYLKMIDGGYRATGVSKRQVRHYADPNKPEMPGVRPFPWNEVNKIRRTQGSKTAKALKERLERKRDLRGTGKVSKAEYEKLEKIQKKRDEIMRKSTAGIQSLAYSIKTMQQIRKAEIEADRKLKTSRKERGKKRREYTSRLSQMKNKLHKRQMKQDERNAAKAKAFEEKNRRYRIVVPSARGGYVKEMMDKTLVTPGAKAGRPPYTRERPGEYNKYIAEKWEVTQTGKMEFKIRLKPGTDMPDTKYFLRNLEYGGTEESTPIIIGYEIEFRDNDAKGRRFKHRRISIRPVLSKPESVSISSHPFVVPTIKRVQREVKNRNKLKTIFAFKET